MELIDGFSSLTDKLVYNEPVFAVATFRQVELVGSDSSADLEQFIHLFFSHTDIQILHLDDDYLFVVLLYSIHSSLVRKSFISLYKTRVIIHAVS